MSTTSKVLEVWLDCDLAPACQVGMLGHERGQIRFRYKRDWLAQAQAFALDPDLSLAACRAFPANSLCNCS